MKKKRDDLRDDLRDDVEQVYEDLAGENARVLKGNLELAHGSLRRAHDEERRLNQRLREVTAERDELRAMLAKEWRRAERAKEPEGDVAKSGVGQVCESAGGEQRSPDARGYWTREEVEELRGKVWREREAAAE
jgi:hypothetical protein